MRPSNRTAIVEAALRVARRQGDAQFSFETTAAEAGLTKAGVLYHFPAREELVLAVILHVAQLWERPMLEALGGPLEDATPAERIRAYVIAAAHDDVSRGEFAIYADALCRPERLGPWNDVFAPWFDLGGCNAEERARLSCARFSADGLWVARATGITPGDGPEHDALVAQLISLTHAEAAA